MNTHPRLPGLLLLVGVLAALASTPVLLTHGQAGKELPWIVSMVGFLAAAGYTWRKLPGHPAVGWFAIAAGLSAIIQALDSAVLLAVSRAGDGAVLAWIMLAQQLGIVGAVVAIAHLIGLFPSGSARHSRERRLLNGLWALVVFPPVVLVSRPTVLFPTYYELAEVTNPYALPALAPLGEAAAVLVTASQAAFAVGVVLLVLRYRRGTQDERRRIRWLLLPAVVAVFAVTVDLLVGGPELLLAFLWISTIVMLPLSIAIALLRPNLLDVDVVLRKSLVYGFLWLLIALAYVAAAAGLGVAAGQRFPLELAIILTVAATVAFHPARRRLERLADQWVFGARTDPTRLIARLGAALEETVELERLLPRMADTLQEGLGLRWARVRLEPAPAVGGDEPAFTVPIMLGEEQLGVVECGPKDSGPLTDEDEAVVTTLARQAALAVRNVRLTAELEASRVRLVRAQDAERRRIERNIHDGVQQDLVALIGSTAHVRSELERDPVSGDEALAELQTGLRRVLAELRELAHGIHPSVLGDRGLLEAVEALAARSTVPVSVRADPSLRGLRFPEEIEGAGYFTVAEALANVGKHASATHAEVSLSRSNGALRIEIRDDGAGFDATAAGSGGLTSLTERLSALGGKLDVASAAGAGTTVTAQISA